jgi:tetratricopeptide (TPR) repeat protein
MDEKNPLNELSDTLRPAVEQIRSAAPPADAVERSQDRAQKLGPPIPRRPRRWLRYCVAAGVAAALVLGFASWPNRSHESSQKVASLRENHASEEALQRAQANRDLRRRQFERSKELLMEKAIDTKVIDDAEKRLQQAEEELTALKQARKPTDLPLPEEATGSPSPSTGTANSPPDSQVGQGSDKAPAPSNGKTTPPSSPSYNTDAPGGPLPKDDRITETTGGRSNVDRSSGKGEGRATMGGGMGMMGIGGGINGGMTGISGGMMGMMGMGGGGSPKNGTSIGGQSRGGETRITTREAAAEAVRRSRQQLQGQLDLDRKSPGSIPSTNTEGLLAKLREAEARLKAFEEEDRKKNQPQVWHRDRSRPTFARVYVGDNNSLELVSMQVNVTIEGPRARTVVDHIFRNPHDRQLEGTFEYPLPTGASPSYFAMFLGQTRETMPAPFARRGDNPPLPAEALAKMTPAELVKHVDTADWGRLQEGRIVSKEKALETYEEVVRGRIDPALLEYSGGNTFSGRVFPIPPKGYNRVILAYEELLPFAQERMIYRLTLPNRKLNELRFHLEAVSAECLRPSFVPKEAKKDDSTERLTFSHTWTNTTPMGDVLFSCTPANTAVQSISGRQGDNGPRYLYARLRPSLKSLPQSKPFASHAVFLLDTSLSEHPERFAVSMRLLQKILENDPDIKQFNILTFNVGAAWLDSKGWFDNTAAGRESALKKLDGIVLEGATDIAGALDKLANAAFDLPRGTPRNVFLLSDGHVTWGEPDVAALAARFERNCPFPTCFYCYRTGLGEENSELFEALTRKGGGVFQCYGETELAAAAKAHRSQCLQVKNVRFVGGPQASDVLVSGRRAAVYPDGELIVAARFEGIGRTTAILEGEYNGKEVVQEFPLEIKSGSELAPRAWAEVAVASLLALHDSNFDALVTAYCQQFGIVSRVASFLVLENEADYKRFNLEEERGKTITGDLGVFITETWTRLSKRMPAVKELERFLTRVNQRIHLLDGAQGAHVKQMLAVLTEEDFDLPAGSIHGGLIYRKDVSGYLTERERDRRDVGLYLKEARRRAESGDVDGAVRALSSIVEEHSGRGDALRLVGYRLLDLQQPGQAARLFAQVQKQRPFEPHSYRDMAHALEQSGLYTLSALNYEAVLAGTWHNRFRQELKLVAEEEYAHMMQEAIRSKRVNVKVANLFGERLEQMNRPQPKSDLRVTISWNTDATDVDLWVIEPDGTKCFYQHNRTHNGGELSQDQTQGYGPERYRIAQAQPGVYTVIVHYFGVNRNLLGGETHVNVTVTRFAGTPRERSERHTVILKKHNEQVEVCKIKF